MIIRKKISLWLYNFLIVQLFITLVTWPIMLWWGLPITPLSIIGNLIFAPFLTGFLLISSIVVLSNLIGYSGTFLIFFLEKFSDLWMFLVTCDICNATTACMRPPIICALCAPLLGLLIIHLRIIQKPLQQICAFLAAYLFLFLLFSLTPQPTKIMVPYGSNNVIITKNSSGLTLFDSGFTRRNGSIDSWIQYTLLPELAKNFGTQTINTICIKKHTPSAFNCAKRLVDKKIARTITIQSTIVHEHEVTMPSFHASASTQSKNP